ncbi:hypothetical protein DdX_18229 [Ditylenchus destructor]|uniref:Uncharacterized protein n=1 Tax=Ditylenchus destructor TaxID=166010 RepID=A0AAD4MLZ7_9BILA|nr:hypothetical protein DdX_18229 [Ditylenchus destructor]
MKYIILLVIVHICSFFDPAHNDQSNLEPIDVFVKEFEDIMATENNGTMKFAHLKERFNPLMEIADSFSRKIVELYNLTDKGPLIVTSQKLRKLHEKVQQVKMVRKFTGPPPQDDPFESVKTQPKPKSGKLWPVVYRYERWLQWNNSIGVSLEQLQYNLSEILGNNLIKLENNEYSGVCEYLWTSPAHLADDLRTDNWAMARAEIYMYGPIAVDDVLAIFHETIAKLVRDCVSIASVNENKKFAGILSSNLRSSLDYIQLIWFIWPTLPIP